jgi:hypothetical protein
LAFFNFDESGVPYVSQGAETILAVTLKDYTSGTAGAPEVVTDSPSGAAGDYSLYFSNGAQASVKDPNKVLDVAARVITGRSKPGLNIPTAISREDKSSSTMVLEEYPSRCQEPIHGWFLSPPSE